MSSTAVSAMDTAPRSAASLNMFLFVRCHEWLAALDADPIERIVSIGDAALQQPPASVRAPACLGSVSAAQQRYAAWDLGLLLGLPALPSAWILAQLPAREGSLALALRTGTCLSVGPLSVLKTYPLPPGILRARRKSIAGVFPISVVQTRRKALLAAGLKLDWNGLWSDEELALSRRLNGEVKV